MIIGLTVQLERSQHSHQSILKIPYMEINLIHFVNIVKLVQEPINNSINSSQHFSDVISSTFCHSNSINPKNSTNMGINGKKRQNLAMVWNLIRLNVKAVQIISCWSTSQYIQIYQYPMITSFAGLAKVLRPSLMAPFTHKSVYFFAAKTVNLPFLADSINEGTVAKLLKKEGDWVDQDETVANIETDKVTVEIKSPNAGVLSKFHVKEGDNLNVGKPFFDVDADGKKQEGAKTADKKQDKKEEKKEEKKESKDDKAEKPQKSSQKAESKPEKTEQKSKHHKEEKAPQKTDKKQAPKPSQPKLTGERKQTREPLSRLRQRVAQRLKQSQNNYALLTTFQQVDMFEAQNTRKALGEQFLKKYNIKLGFMSFFLRAATLALQEYPVVNSVIDGNEIVRRNFIDISVAVATPTGLMVPVLRNCQNLKFHELEQGMADLAKKGKDGKISIEDMQGGTFTISNGGTFGSLMGTPILNPPQSAILGMHSIIERPVVRAGQIVARPMMYLALTYDHRLLDGKDAVLFLKRIQTHIEDPRRMLLQI